ncbi:MAG: hypothetical protein ACSLE8_06325 [Rhodococcus sp. (in: high G+C Gram-positive bacteria)]
MTMVPGLMRQAAARAKGFTIDNHAGGRPIGYKGPRFRPDAWVQLHTELEEELIDRIADLEAKVGVDDFQDTVPVSR